MADGFCALADPRPGDHLIGRAWRARLDSGTELRPGPPATATRDEVIRVTDQASGPSPAAPAELAALLAAAGEAEREQAWADFVRTFTPLLLRVARSLGGDADGAMDRYAFVLDRLREDDCRRLRAYLRPGAGDFTLWLVVVVRRLGLDHYRERYGRQRTADGPEERAQRAGRRRLVDLVAERTDPALLASEAGLAPDEGLMRAERTKALSSALAGLSPPDRLLLRLRFAESLPAREIARLMRFPTLFHVYRRLDKVLSHLRDALSRAGIEPGP
jgi:RNA polymerase sigma factor (sigma-70 family)